LLQHAQNIRDTYGDPDPAWPTAVSTAAHRTYEGLPSPASTEAISAADARGELGLSASTLRTWVQRGKIHPVGRDFRGHPLYFKEHLMLLKARSAACPQASL